MIAYVGPTEIIDYYVIDKVVAEKKIAWMYFDPTKVNMNRKLYSFLYKKYDKRFLLSQKGEARN